MAGAGQWISERPQGYSEVVRVRLHNIGPIRDADVEFSSLTVLVGPNGSGKTTFTYVTYALWLAHLQATNAAVDSLGNPFIASRREGAPAPRTAVNTWEEAFQERLDFELRRCWGPDLSPLSRARRRGKGAGPRIELATDRWCMSFRLDGDEIWLDRDARNYARPTFRWPKDATRKARREKLISTLGGGLPLRAQYFPAGRSGFVQTHTAISGLVLSALSGGYFQDATVGAIPGPTADFMRLVAQISTQARARRTNVVAKELEQRLLRGELRLDDANGSREFLFRPEGHDVEWPVQTMSTAVAELAALVLYLRYVASPGDAVLIDEPESHLHPSTQVPLADVLLAMASLAPPVVVATHSEFLVSALSNALLRARASDDDPTELGVFAFTFHDEDRGLGTDVSPVTVDPDEGFAIEQFAEVAADTYREGIRLYNAVHDVD